VDSLRGVTNIQHTPQNSEVILTANQYTLEERNDERVQPTCRFGNKAQNSVDEVAQIIQ